MRLLSMVTHSRKLTTQRKTRNLRHTSCCPWHSAQSSEVVEASGAHLQGTAKEARLCTRQDRVPNFRVSPMVLTISETSRFMIEGEPLASRGQRLGAATYCSVEGNSSLESLSTKGIHEPLGPCREVPPLSGRGREPKSIWGENLKVCEPGRHAKWTSQGEMPP